MKISDYAIEYLRYCRVEKRNSDASVKTYQYALRNIVSAIGDVSVKDIEQNVILELKEKIMKHSDDRQSLIVSVLKNFLKYLRDFYDIDVYDHSKITIPRVKRKHPEIFTSEEIYDFIENVLPSKTLRDKRFKGLNAMLAESGARIQEVLNLPRNIKLSDRQATVCGKGGIPRIIYWGDSTIYHMKNYSDARPKEDRSPYLFGTVNKGDYCGKWNKGDVNRKFRYWSKKLGKRIHCHKYRSSFLSNCLHEGMNLSAVSKAMGHTDIRTSMRYFSPMSDENTKAEFEKYFIRKATIDARGRIKNLTN